MPRSCRDGRVLNDAFRYGSTRRIGILVALGIRGTCVTIGVSATEGDPDMFEIVGVVGDVRPGSLVRPTELEIYVPQAQHTWGWSAIAVRTTGRPQALAATVRREVDRLDPELALIATATMPERLASSLAVPRLVATLLALFAGVAAALAGIGLYGVLATAVVRRTGEIGVRMALGARLADVLRLVVREAARMAGVGIAVGMVAATALTRLMTALLFGVSPRDPRTFPRRGLHPVRDRPCRGPGPRVACRADRSRRGHSAGVAPWANERASATTCEFPTPAGLSLQLDAVARLEEMTCG